MSEQLANGFTPDYRFELFLLVFLIGNILIQNFNIHMLNLDAYNTSYVWVVGAWNQTAVFKSPWSWSFSLPPSSLSPSLPPPPPSSLSPPHPHSPSYSHEHGPTILGAGALCLLGTSRSPPSSSRSGWRGSLCTRRGLATTPSPSAWYAGFITSGLMSGCLVPALRHRHARHRCASPGAPASQLC